jgi:hypothetical protein
MNLSTDYEVLHQKVCGSKGKIPCFIDYRYRSQPEEAPPYRDVAAVRLLGDDIEIGVRGLSYLIIQKDNQAAFVKWCTSLNVEWVV